MKTTLDELQAFAAVVDGGSITAAAERLGQTVSGISRSLGRLEQKLATTLLRRTTRRLELTEEGEVFLARARQILAAVDEAEEQMAARREQPAGRLRVDAATPFMLHVIAPLVDSYRAAHPQVTLELHSNEGITDLIEHRTDVAFRIGTLRDSTLHARPWAAAASGCWPARTTWPAAARPGGCRTWPATPCWASPSRRRSTTGRCARPRAHRCASRRPSPRPAARRCASWPWPARASSACRTS
jgi:DNA-binding transcriptional LysR family regulator